MSQLVLDDQLSIRELVPVLRKWITVERLGALRPGEHILDDRVPEILRTLRQPTFVTIDHHFWDRRLCHPGYCILYFALREDQQAQLPELLRALFRLPHFRSRAARMGKVARVGPTQVLVWQAQQARPRWLLWRK